MPNAIEEAAARAAGKFRALQATERGLKGVFRRLAEEHKEAAILLKRAAVSSELSKRTNLWKKVRADMLAHERSELEEVYPDFEAHPALTDIVELHELEAKEISKLIAKLDCTDLDSSQWVSLLRQLEHVWATHAEREEAEFFPRIQGIIGNARAQELEQRYVATKNAILEGL